MQKALRFSNKRDKAQNIVTLNTLMLLEGWREQEFLDTLKRADLLISDSVGISISATLFSLISYNKDTNIIRRYPGIELMQTLIKKGKKSFFLGGKKGVAKTAAQKLKKKFSNTKICGYHHGYFSDEQEKKIIENINRVRPQILFVGLNMKQQEFWIDRNKNSINAGLIMGVGGSFDVLSGNLKRAPVLFRISGLEWTWRLMIEPWRLLRILNLPVFVVKAMYRFFAGKNLF
ncbi:MAG: WecB/TagA/CpsF family glycosyltransferase [Elusimicrobiota bacterium]